MFSFLWVKCLWHRIQFDIGLLHYRENIISLPHWQMRRSSCIFKVDDWGVKGFSNNDVKVFAKGLASLFPLPTHAKQSLQLAFSHLFYHHLPKVFKGGCYYILSNIGIRIVWFQIFCSRSMISHEGHRSEVARSLPAYGTKRKTLLGTTK